MDQIKHSHIEVTGLKLHIAEIGTGILWQLSVCMTQNIFYPFLNNSFAFGLIIVANLIAEIHVIEIRIKSGDFPTWFPRSMVHVASSDGCFIKRRFQSNNTWFPRLWSLRPTN